MVQSNSDQENLAECRKLSKDDLLSYRELLRQQATDKAEALRQMKIKAVADRAELVSEKAVIDSYLQNVSVVFKERADGKKAKTVKYTDDVLRKFMPGAPNFAVFDDISDDEVDEVEEMDDSDVPSVEHDIDDLNDL